MIANVLTIAGTDPSGGAGISADLKTFSALGVYGMMAITAVVAQNTTGVQAFQTLSTDFISQQIHSVFDDVKVDAVKIGMVATADIAQTIVNCLKQYPGVPIVLDPVMVAKSGDLLLKQDAIDVIRNQLVPLATIITPNLMEAGVLLNQKAPVTTDEMQAILPDLAQLGSPWVMLKGGGLLEETSTTSIDYLYGQGKTTTLTAQRIKTDNLHGTGCTLSAAIAAYLTRYDMIESAQRAKTYLTQALAASNQLNVGHGHGPVHHFYDAWK